jgi:hypothetical protein
MSYTEEQLYKSKIATESGLLKLGENLLLKKQQKHKIGTYKNDVIKELTNIKNGNKILKQFDLYSDAMDQTILNLKKLLSSSEEDYKEVEITSSDYLKELETLEEKIENYWKVRVENLRNKCIKKNKTLKMYRKIIKCQGILLLLFFLNFIFFYYFY